MISRLYLKQEHVFKEFNLIFLQCKILFLLKLSELQEGNGLDESNFI